MVCFGSHFSSDDVFGVTVIMAMSSLFQNREAHLDHFDFDLFGLIVLDLLHGHELELAEHHRRALDDCLRAEVKTDAGLGSWIDGASHYNFWL